MSRRQGMAGILAEASDVGGKISAWHGMAWVGIGGQAIGSNMGGSSESEKEKVWGGCVWEGMWAQSGRAKISGKRAM